MSKLHDAKWRATVDLVVPREDEPHLGVSIPEGAVVPEHLRERVEAMEQTPGRKRG